VADEREHRDHEAAGERGAVVARDAGPDPATDGHESRETDGEQGVDDAESRDQTVGTAESDRFERIDVGRVAECQYREHGESEQWPDWPGDETVGESRPETLAVGGHDELD
jgi:hypothetical protein